MWLDIAEEFASLQSAACGSPSRRAYRPQRSCGRVAEGGGLLNRYRVVKPYRGFESLRLRHPSPCRASGGRPPKTDRAKGGSRSSVESVGRHLRRLDGRPSASVFVSS